MSRRPALLRALKGYWVGGLLAVALLGGVTEAIVGLLQSNHLERQRIEVLNRLATIRARLEGEINSTLHLTRGLIAFVAIHPDFESSEFDALASEIIAVGRNIRNIGLARDNVITHIYPLAGNEAALGLEYEKMPDQWPAIKQAIAQRGTVVAGPVDLVQGGHAFIARTPIYTRSSLGGHLTLQKPAYWGLASIVIDMKTLFDSVGLEKEMDGIQFALRGKDAVGEAGDMIFGDPALFGADPVVQSVLLPNGNWQIGAIPLGGWLADAKDFWPPRLAGWLGALMVGFLIASLLRAREINKLLALHDYLTDLPNRRLLDDRFEQMVARSGRGSGGFAVYYIDLDDFKEVNDRFGHRAGDGLLVEVAKRLRTSVRAMDTVARIGGDEFIVLADGIREIEVMSRVAESLLADLRGSVYADGHRLELHASIGFARYPEDGQDLDQLTKAADRMMYEVKQRGKVFRMDRGRTGEGG